MNNTEFDNTLKKLEGQVSQFSSVATDFEIPKNNSILSKIDFKSNVVYYVLVPIIIMIVFYIFKPCFVMTETTTTDVNLITITEKKLNFKRLIISTIICTFTISFLIFCYLYKKQLQKT